MWTTGILFIIALACLSVLIHYRLRIMQQQRQDAFSTIIPHLQERSKRIQALLDFAAEYITNKVEFSLLDHIRETISITANTEEIEDRVGLENQMDTELYEFFTLIENHKTLSIHETIYDLKDNLIETEAVLAEYTLPFNMITDEYNDMLLTFPANPFFKFLGFRLGVTFTMLEIDDDNNESLDLLPFDKKSE